MIPYFINNEISLIDGSSYNVSIDGITHLEIVTYPAQEKYNSECIVGFVQRPFIDFALSCGLAGAMTEEMIIRQYGNKIPLKLASALVSNFSREYNNYKIIPDGIAVVITADPINSIYEIMVNDGNRYGGIALNDPKNNFAQGLNSVAEGIGTIATGNEQHVQGRFNYVDENGNAGDYAYIVGNGNENNRSNAYTLDWSGNAWFAGYIKIGTKQEIVATESYVEAKVAELINIGDINTPKDKILLTDRTSKEVYEVYIDNGELKIFNTNKPTLVLDDTNAEVKKEEEILTLSNNIATVSDETLSLNTGILK